VIFRHKLTHNIEVALRYKLDSPHRYFTDNSISAPERIYIDVQKAKNWNLTRESSMS